jgi:hypothetical protein
MSKKNEKKMKFRSDDLQRIFEKFIEKGGSDCMKNLLNQLKNDIETMNSFLTPLLHQKASSDQSLSSMYWNPKMKKIFLKELDINGEVISDKDLLCYSDKTILESDWMLEDFFKTALNSLRFKVIETNE